MARVPVNVLVFPYRRRASGVAEFVLFRRADDPGFWGIIYVTKQPALSDDSKRQAGASHKVEISPAMLLAGETALADLGEASPSVAAEVAYRAMELARMREQALREIASNL